VADIYEEYYRLKELRQNENWREMLDAPVTDETVTEEVSGNTDENNTIQ